MTTHADKTPEDKSTAGANNLPKQPSNSKSTFQFVDNRPEAIAQRKLQEIANNSPRVKQLMAIQEMANNSPQAKKTAQLQAIANNYAAQRHQPIQKKENKTGLPDNLKSGVENLSGMSLDDVTVHYNSDKPAQLQAHAYAQGTDIHIASGQEKHLPHEAWHVVQQKQGRVQPTMQMKGKVNINDDAGLEKEADVMGAKAFQLVENRAQTTNVQNIASIPETQTVKQLQPSISGSIIQRNWDSSGEEPIYRDDKHKVTWHLCSDGELWYESHQESSPYAGYAGIKNKGSYAKWFMLGAAPFELLKEQASDIKIPEQSTLDQKFHEAYRLYVYLIGISTLKWEDIKDKPPFSQFGWTVIRIYEHYSKHVNPLVEKEDGGLNAYYGPFYKRMNPFLRAIRAKFGDERYNQIIEGHIGGDSEELVKILSTASKEAKFNSDVDESTLKDVLAEIRGAKKEIKKNSETKPIDINKIPTVYRGDFEGLAEIIAKDCGFGKAVFDQTGTFKIGKNWTQFQFVSTTTNKQIGPPADTGTIWKIELGARSMGTLGGLYTAEQEVLFAPKTSFYIEKIVLSEKYDKTGPIGDDKTKYIVFARQG